MKCCWWILAPCRLAVGWTQPWPIWPKLPLRIQFARKSMRKLRSVGVLRNIGGLSAGGKSSEASLRIRSWMAVLIREIYYKTQLYCVEIWNFDFPAFSLAPSCDDLLPSGDSLVSSALKIMASSNFKIVVSWIFKRPEGCFNTFLPELIKINIRIHKITKNNNLHSIFFEILLKSPLPVLNHLWISFFGIIFQVRALSTTAASQQLAKVRKN